MHAHTNMHAHIHFGTNQMAIPAVTPINGKSANTTVTRTACPSGGVCVWGGITLALSKKVTR